MTTANPQGPDGAGPTQTEAPETQSLTFDEIIQRRTQELSERSVRKPVAEPPQDEDSERENTQDNPEDETEEVDEPAESEAAEEEGIADEEEADDVLRKFNLEDMSEDELAALGQAIKSKVPKRFGELTKRAKSAEERIAQLEAKLREQETSTKNPLERERPIENNPFAKIDTVDQLQEQADHFAAVEEWAENLLEENEDEHADSVIAENDGKDLTKREVRQYLKKARLARSKFLPARYAEIQAAEQRKQMEAILLERGKTEFDWVQDDDSVLKREYEALLNDPHMQKIAERVPEVLPQIKYILLHFVDSYTAKNQAAKKVAAPKKAPIKPPSNPTGGSARSVTDRDQSSKELNELSSRLKESGSYEDWIALRSKQRLRKS